eukprot:GDKK01001786.1.p1 GENE.GDKK01001786.1~~GDKK01001786.1.p1  ORF type:complete len:282 (+),score=15.60 GDKK01001786.1:37-882(+)
MATSVGVVFYWLRKGDHPEVARQTKGKLPVDSTSNLTVAKAIEIISANHSISSSKYLITVFEEKSSRQLVNPDEVLTNYSRIYLGIDSKKIEDVDSHDTSTDIKAKAKDEDWRTRIAGGASGIDLGSSLWHPITSATCSNTIEAQTLPMEKLVAINTQQQFPLKLTPAVISSKECPLCHQVADSAVELDCCGYTCCNECLTYVKDSGLFSDDAKCVICGRLSTDQLLSDPKVEKISGFKREREEQDPVPKEKDQPFGLKTDTFSDEELDDDDFNDAAPITL